MPMPISDISGQRYGRLTVVSIIKRRTKGNGVIWQCRCDCGNTALVASGNLRSGGTKSCGCWRSERLVKHGHATNGSTATYSSWKSMLTRCKNKDRRGYKHYGGKGVKVCDRWLDFANFLEDMGEKPSPGWHIDRIDPSGDYEPANCEWVSPSENSLRMHKYHNHRIKNASL